MSGWYGIEAMSNPPRIAKGKKLGKVAGHCQNCNIVIGTKELYKECTRCGAPHGIPKSKKATSE